ncbi:conjugal transfer protein TraG (plasmid) [Bermanella marisrubri]|uniref:TraG n=1 Tax=Bermanella marisrubri TaxID=207949 RepID=Q1MY30_9GAMM|nr:conjugal transfer protein TraG N-terminal domain-containing protein [Bermanella marisrubri]EAT10866.1 TraG [Oceanobacter sp. RED65] [Bermanella marisrubri]QIZ85919.1 conjugal transfer protein TraG [Bermanella marisrubri]
MNWEVITYGNAELLTLVFNGIAMIFGGADIWGAMRTIALISFIAWMFQVAFSKGDINPKWLIGFIIILSAVLMPRTDVVVTDRIYPSNTTVVSNVPLGLAATSSFLNNTSDWLARTIEVVFSLPNGHKYSDSGMLWGNRLMQATMEHRVADPMTAGNLARFAESCIIMDLGLERYSLEDLSTEDDLASFFANSSSILYFNYKDQAGSGSLTQCNLGWQQIVDDIDANLDAEFGLLGRLISRDENATSEIVSRVKTSLPVGLQYFAGSAKTESDILKQNMILNSLETGLGSSYSNVSESWVIAKAERDRSITQSALARIGENTLPLARNIYEALLYAAFPIIAMMLMLPTAGKVALGYVKALAWINLWIPMYALINFVANYYAQNAIQALPDASTGISLLNQSALYRELNEASEMAGYMSLSIPLLAWMFVQQGGSLAAGMANRMVASYESAVDGAASSASSGNYNQGNVNMDNLNAFKTDSSIQNTGGFTQSTNDLGSMKTSFDGSRSTMQLDQSSAGFSLDFGSMTSERLSAQYSESVQQLENTSRSLAETNDSAYKQSIDFGENLSQSDMTKDVSVGSDTTSYQDSLQEVNTLRNQAAKELGLTDDEMTRAMGRVQAGVDWKSDESFWGGLAEKASGLSVSASASASGEIASESRASELYRAVTDFASSDQYTSAVSDMAQVTQSLAAERTDASSSDFSEKIGSTVSDQMQYREDKTEALAEVNQAQASRDRVEAATANMSKQMLDEFLVFSTKNNTFDTKSDAMEALADYRDGRDDGRVESAIDNFIDQRMDQMLTSESAKNGESMEQDGYMPEGFSNRNGDDLRSSYEENQSSFEENAQGEVVQHGISGAENTIELKNAESSLNSSEGILANNEQIRQDNSSFSKDQSDIVDAGKETIEKAGDRIQGDTKDTFIENGVGGMSDTEYMDGNRTREGDSSSFTSNSFLNKGVMDRSDLFDTGMNFNTFGENGKGMSPSYDESGKIDYDATSNELKETNNPDTVPDRDRDVNDSYESDMADLGNSRYDDFSNRMKGI